jgi:hypothetical protein
VLPFFVGPRHAVPAAVYCGVRHEFTGYRKRQNV